jgi:hypothetical protein
MAMLVLWAVKTLDKIYLRSPNLVYTFIWTRSSARWKIDDLGLFFKVTEVKLYLFSRTVAASGNFFSTFL